MKLKTSQRKLKLIADFLEEQHVIPEGSSMSPQDIRRTLKRINARYLREEFDYYRELYGALPPSYAPTSLDDVISHDRETRRIVNKPKRRNIVIHELFPSWNDLFPQINSPK